MSAGCRVLEEASFKCIKIKWWMNSKKNNPVEEKQLTVHWNRNPRGCLIPDLGLRCRRKLKFELDYPWKWQTSAFFEIGSEVRKGGEGSATNEHSLTPAEEVITRPRKDCLGCEVQLFCKQGKLTLQSCAEKKDCFAKHQPGVGGCGWLQPGRNFLST